MARIKKLSNEKPDIRKQLHLKTITNFACKTGGGHIHQPDWVTRANLMAKYFDCRLDDPFTDWVIGMGGDLHARLYEKVVEIKTKSHKTWLFSLWRYLTSDWLRLTIPSLTDNKRDRWPNHPLCALTSFMAREGIEDFSEGIGEYLHQACKYHARNAGGFYGYVQRKVKAKGRKYNTINNRENLAETIQERKQRAKAYQSVKDGE